MNKTVFACLLIVLGLIIIILGARREDSVVGLSDAVGTTLANAWDGKVRQPGYVWYYVGGGGLMLAGAVLLLRRKAG
ncbi:MAG: hypothetical protein KIT44_00285 [Opitutaceae bacterium]|nr:hypothetical protein [Opitutaceae bacterium]